MASGFVAPIAIIGLLVLAVFSARAYDVHHADRGVVA
jgi:hypothetical protein